MESVKQKSILISPAQIRKIALDSIHLHATCYIILSKENIMHAQFKSGAEDHEG
jgi:hypothetical protein